MVAKRKTLRWRREPRATGLAGACQGTRGWELRWGEELIGEASVLSRHDRYAEGPWYWWAGGRSVPNRNTVWEPLIETAEEAKTACLAYVRLHLVREVL